MRSIRNGRRSTAVALASAAAAFAALAMPRAASATVLNGGVEAGLVKRYADAPSQLKLGTGWGAHAELHLLPTLGFGPYYQHYELAFGENTTTNTKDSIFDVLGARARFVLPLPGSSWRPYAYVGIGYTWVTNPATPLPFDMTNPAAKSGGFATNDGHFWETPIGVGVAYEVLKLVHLSLDVAWRPGMSFGGSAYEGVPPLSQPRGGWSAMLGAALDL